MPFKPPRICPCGERVPYGTLCACQQRRAAERRAAAEQHRPTARQRGYSPRWEKASRTFLAHPENRLCACGCGRIADMVDHIRAHKGDQRLFWDRANWQPMARACNTRKAIREEGGFGRTPGGGRQLCEGTPDRRGFRDARDDRIGDFR